MHVKQIRCASELIIAQHMLAHLPLKAEPTRVRGIDTLTPCKPVNLVNPSLYNSNKKKFASITKRVMNASAKQVRQGRYADSVEVRGKCYCLSNFDHGIGNMAAPSEVETLDKHVQE
jgi:hypothetical protein